MIETTVHFTCYNEIESIQKCVESFLSTIDYDKKKLELIIVDNGSTNNEVVEYVKNLNPEVGNYVYILNDFNDYPTCLKFGKVQARRIAQGRYFIDIPDDHLFFVKSNWIQDSIDHLENDMTAGCICYAAQPSYRYFKPNNKSIFNEKNKNYIKSLLKGYADYHIMTRAAYETAGEFKSELGRKSEGEYMDRMLSMGYFRNIMKFPVALINDHNFSLIEPITEEELIERFKNKNFVTNEDVIHYLIQKKKIEKRK